MTRSIASDGFGDWMLHLDTGVHLDEVDGSVFIHEELDRTGILIADLGQAALEGAGEALHESWV